MNSKKVLARAEVSALAKKGWYLMWVVFAVILFFLGKSEERGYSSSYRFTNLFGERIKTVSTSKSGVTEVSYDTEVIIIMAIIFLIIILIPFIVQAIRKKIAKNISLTLYEDEIQGSYSNRSSRDTLQMPIEKLDNLSIKFSFWNKLFFPGKTVVIRSASGVFAIPMVQNADEVVEIAMNRIKEIRETNKKEAPVVRQETGSLTEKLNELNSLKEAGIITEEEYNKKKADLISKL